MALMSTPVETRIIRSAATGPEPCNTLVFLRCLVPGLDVPVGNDEHVRSTLHFMTEFRLDGYQQSLVLARPELRHRCNCTRCKWFLL